MTTALVVLPSTTYRARDFVTAADALGIDLIVASEQPPPFDMGDRYLQIDCADARAAAASIVGLGDRVPIDGVVAADDAGVVVAALSGQELGLRANDPDAASAARDKASQRQRLERAEVPQPRFAILDPVQDPEAAAQIVGFPLIVKPTDRSAAQGVVRVDRPEDLASSVELVRGIVGEDSRLLVESFLPGEEVAVEGIVRDGELTVLALFDKPDAGTGPFFPETILVTPSTLDESTQTECQRVAQAALRGIGISHGPVHVELKVAGEDVRVIEVAARSIGGLCSQSLNFGLMGTTLESLILRNAVGWDKPELKRERSASGVLMIPIPRRGTFRGIEGLESVRRLDHVTSIDITARPGSPVAPPPEGDSYLGFVFARAGDPSDVVATLRQASDRIEVRVE